jgi:hypothetical protein
MITSLGKHAVAAVLAVGGLSAPAPAHASGFSAAFTCNIANLGQTTALLNGWLSSPGTTFSGPARFRLHISSLTLQAPAPIDSWSATAWINVSGAENTTFQVSGGGGALPIQGAIAGDLAGTWAPYVAGTDLLSVGGIEISANSREAGSLPVQCVPNGAPVAEVLRVASPYRGRWIRPNVPVFHVGGWYHRGMALHHPIWTRPGRPGWHGPDRPGWHSPDRPGWHSPDRPGDWNRPGVPVHAGGGWNRPDIPVHHPGEHRFDH